MAARNAGVRKGTHESFPPIECATGGLRARHRRCLVGLLVALTGACRRDYSFHTVAVYEAPRSGCVVRMEANGTVRGGDDVSRASRGTPMIHDDRGADHAVSQEIVLREGEVLFGERGPRVQSDALFRLMTEAGCAPFPREVDELRAATEGVLRGPKGTFMDGQTKTLKVRSTTFDR